MRRVLSWVYLIGVLAALGVGVTALLNWLTHEHQPLWTGALMMLVLMAGTELLKYCETRGWITMGLWTRSKVLEKREHKLAMERERILAAAKSKI